MPKIPYHQEALSTLENAAELISLSPIDEIYYTDIKKVKDAGKAIGNFKPLEIVLLLKIIQHGKYAGSSK